MLNSEIVSHLLVTIIYFLLISLFHFKLDINLFWLWLGAFGGTFLLDIDHLLYWFVVHPEKEDSQQAKALLKFRNYKGMYRILLAFHATHTRLIFHTALFQIVLFILAFYVISSGGSFFGSGLVMAACLHLLKDEWQDYQKDKERLADWLFWQIKGIPVQKYLKLYLAAASLIFAGLSILLI